MTETLLLQVSTHVFGLGNARTTEPIYIVLPERTITGRALIACAATRRRIGSCAWRGAS